jgi:hypothetical protein
VKILRSLDAITAANIEQLCRDKVFEGTEVEFKQTLSTRDAKPDGWLAGNAVGDAARNAIGEEITAFANTFGGVVHELALRLR